MERPRSNMTHKEKPVTCPFCEQRIPRPRPLPVGELDGGRCTCGALFVADFNGKAGGQALMDGLTALCEGDVDRAMELSSGTDYEMQKIGYRPRTHSLEPRLPGHGAYGHPKLWFFRLLTPAS